MAHLTAAQRGTLFADAWFAGLPGPVQDEVLDAAMLRWTSEGERLHACAEPAPAWFGLVEGAVRLGVTTPDGRQGLLGFLAPGTWFGDLALLDGGTPPVDAVSHGDATLLEFSAPHFADLLERYPVLYRHFADLGCRRLRALLAALGGWTALTLEERLAHHLRALADTHGRRSGDEVAIALHLPQEQIAQLLGASRQRVSQLLREWERQGRVHVRYGRVVVDGAWLAAQGGEDAAAARRDVAPA